MGANIAMAIGEGLKGFTSGAMQGINIVAAAKSRKMMEEYRRSQGQYFKDRGEYYKKRGETLSQMPPEAMKYYHQNAVWDHTNRQMDSISAEIEKQQAAGKVDPALANKYIQLRNLVPQLRKQLDASYSTMIGKGVDPMHLHPIMEQADIPEPVPPKQPTADDLEEQSGDQEDRSNYQGEVMDQMQAPAGDQSGEQ
jgi:hypothetical protein